MRSFRGVVAHDAGPARAHLELHGVGTQTDLLPPSPALQNDREGAITQYGLLLWALCTPHKVRLAFSSHQDGVRARVAIKPRDTNLMIHIRSRRG